MVLPAEAGKSIPKDVAVNAHGLSLDKAALADYLSPFTPPEYRPKGLRGLAARRESRELTIFVFGEPPPDNPTPEQAQAMREADEARIQALQKAMAELQAGRKSLSGPPDIVEATGYGNPELIE